MKFKKIKAIYAKEMLDLLRDKKTLIMMILVPLLLYPLIMIGTMLISSAVISDVQTSEYQVSIKKDIGITFETDKFVTFLENTEDDLEYNLKVVDCKDCESALIAEEIDAYIQINETDKKIKFDVYYLSSITSSSAASDMIEDKLKLYSENMTYEMLKEKGLDAEFIMNPIEVSWEDKSSKEESLGSFLGQILPLLLITTIMLGALYPAIDITSGEKERGTLETLLTLPVRNDELIMGKFLAVSTIAIVSAILNLISMAIMGGFMMGMMNSSGEGSTSVDLAGFIPAIFIVVLCIIAFTLFISAVIMCITTFAKSFKEANNYSTPLLLVVMLACYIGFIPNIEFTSLLAAVPVVNICLLISNILVFKYEFSLIIIVLVTNVAYAAIAIWVLSKIYDSEDIVFGEGGASLQIFTNRKELKKGGVPNFSDAVIVAAVSMLLLLYVGSIVQMKFLLGGLLITQFMIIGVPVFVAWYTKKDFKQTFSLNVPKVTGIIGAVILEIGIFAAVMVLSALLVQIWPEDAGSVNESFGQILDGVTFVQALLVIALAPAICEEALFRGYLLAATKKKFKPVAAILIVAALFGIYHLSLVKFFTTGLLGAAFCYVVYKTGSIFLSCLMHFINNAISVILVYYGENFETIVPVLFKETLESGEIIIMLVIAAVCSGLGILFINMGQKKTAKN